MHHYNYQTGLVCFESPLYYTRHPLGLRLGELLLFCVRHFNTSGQPAAVTPITEDIPPDTRVPRKQPDGKPDPRHSRAAVLAFETQTLTDAL